MMGFLQETAHVSRNENALLLQLLENISINSGVKDKKLQHLLGMIAGKNTGEEFYRLLKALIEENS